MRPALLTVTTNFAGLHQWENAPEKVAFLRNLHRHIFYVDIVLRVVEHDRELEFFCVQEELNEVIDVLYTDYRSVKGLKYVGGRSCEMIADQLRAVLSLTLPVQCVTVSEDRENSATVYSSTQEGSAGDHA